MVNITLFSESAYFIVNVLKGTSFFQKASFDAKRVLLIVVDIINIDKLGLLLLLLLVHLLLLEKRLLLLGDAGILLED